MRALALALLMTACGAASALALERSEERADCAHHDPLRQPFFGDTHVHTTFSFDAWVQGTRNDPDAAYRFARGEPVGIQPYDAAGEPARRVRLTRPLDFAIVTDHAEMLGETQLCRDPASAGFAAHVCRLLRRFPALGYMIVNTQWGSDGGRRVDLCGADGAPCREAARGPWAEIQRAAEAHYDRSSACRFTTFVGVEWSGTREGMIHRNLVFRNARVPALPPNAIDDGHDETRLWRRLERECLDAGGGCDVLAIPHNSNLSGGSMFWRTAPDGTPIDAELAARRARLEPLIEITQHKGDSECRAGGADEACGFETVPFSDVAGHASSLYREPPAPLVYVREALLEGLALERALGVNPYRLGIVGSTDTHLGTPGRVEEGEFLGHAAGTVSARLEVPALPDSAWWNPGGLAGVWAEENSRDAIFAALRRRETFGTSGPRIAVRLFAGFGLDRALCDAPDFAARGGAGGVPMGGELTGAAAEAPLRIAVQSLRDPHAEAAALERIQIVKGWLEDGEPREQVFDVAGQALDAEPDTACTPPPGGAARLCRVWQDPGFDPAQPAFYYARVLEVPTCRWSARVCLDAAVDCASWLPGGALKDACCDGSLPRAIRERAWTSPVWYTPTRRGGIVAP